MSTTTKPRTTTPRGHQAATKVDLVNTAALNSWQNDYTTDDGVRVSTPIYIDIPQQQRKDLFSKLRSLVEAEKIISTPSTQSGISVSTAVPNGANVETHIGISMDNLRSIIFARGGIDVSLLLKIQSVTGEEIISLADFEKALKYKIAQVKEFASAHQYNHGA